MDINLSMMDYIRYNKSWGYEHRLSSSKAAPTEKKIVAPTSIKARRKRYDTPATVPVNLES
jgi:hypothetical protein